VSRIQFKVFQNVFSAGDAIIFAKNASAKIYII